MTTDDVRTGRRPALDNLDDVPDDMSQEEQARGLVEPAFDHHIENEAELLAAEFGPPDKDGGYGRGPDDYAEAGS
ncbi:hypothetical protein [Kribbella sp. NPDC004536]|uniref:hypothetical protein n=1 Tax=Kribbella sp. NPDC004536 TaxID=3364106 RepID=UPI0036BFDA87